jgi:excisionase family DNA binding protein
MVTNIEEIPETPNQAPELTAPETPITSTLDPSRPESWPMWLDVNEVSQILRLSVSTLRYLNASGKMRGRKFGRRVRWRRDQILALTPEG